MLKKRLSMTLMGVLVLIVTTLTEVPVYSATLSERDSRLIEIAFMNGFVAALKLDEETATRLRKDRQLLRQVVTTKSKEYLDLVEGLNKASE